MHVLLSDRYGVLETQRSNGIADMGSVKPELGER
jgi:hypothetical protein